MYFIIWILLNVLIIGLFLYSKLLPYKDRLDQRYKGTFDFFSKLLNFLRGVFKPTQVGSGLSVDMSQIVLLIVLLLLLGIGRF